MPLVCLAGRYKGTAGGWRRNLQGSQSGMIAQDKFIAQSTYMARAPPTLNRSTDQWRLPLESFTNSCPPEAPLQRRRFNPRNFPSRTARPSIISYWRDIASKDALFGRDAGGTSRPRESGAQSPYCRSQTGGATTFAQDSWNSVSEDASQGPAER